MKIMVLVSHPDDEFIFSHNYISMNNHKDNNIIVVCATHSWGSPRGKKFIRSCEEMKVKGLLLCLSDPLYDEDLTEKERREIEKEYPLNFDSLDCEMVRELIQSADVLVTHNPFGEYGHRHHVDCFNFAEREFNPKEGDDKKMFVFAQNYKKEDFGYDDENKINSVILNDIYKEEKYLLYHFNLIHEGFCRYFNS